MAKPSLSGTYLGRALVREGRADELSSQERKQLLKGEEITLELREDGTFFKQVTEGTWTVSGDRIVFQPVKFGGKTEQEMVDAAAEMGRAFGLRFVFFPFELEIHEDVLVSPDASTLIYTEYRRA